MIAEYPPLPTPVKKPAKSIQDTKSLPDDDADLSEIPHGRRVDFVSDILWVYSNLANHAVAPRNTPNGGA